MISIYKKDLGKGLETSKLSKVGFDLQIVFIERHFRAKGGLKCSIIKDVGDGNWVLF